MLLPALADWQSKGRYFPSVLAGHQVFYRDLGDPAAAPERTLLLLHGFPESSFSYHKVVAGLSELFSRVVLFDFLGYGLSDKPVRGYAYSLFEQADIALQLWQHLGIAGGHLLAHDMGDSVATELAARHVGGSLPGWFSAGFQSFTFTNGNMAMDLAELRLGQKALLSRAGPWFSRMVAGWLAYSSTIRSAHGNRQLSREDIELMWNNTIQQDGQLKNHLVIQYLNDRKRFEKTRWLPSLARLQEPVHICWGEDDAVSPVKVARHLKQNVCPQARLTVMPGVGHFCQLSNPEAWLASVAAFWQAPAG